MRPSILGPRRYLPMLVAANSLGIIVLAVVLTFAFNSIQDSRVSAAIYTCVQTNDRHDLVLSQYERELNQLPAGRRATARKSSQGLLRIFEAAVPHRDNCRAYARDVVSRK
jgi:hypothetical protein